MRNLIVSTTLLNDKRQILNADFEFYIEELLNSLFDKINYFGISNSRSFKTVVVIISAN